MTTKEKVKEIQDEIEHLNSQLVFMRNSCPHVDLSIQHIGSTGNFDPSDDGYVKRYEWGIYSYAGHGSSLLIE